MDVFSSLSDPNSYGSPLSDGGSSRPRNFSDDNEAEVLLASENPKKRAGRKKFRVMRHPVYRGVRRRDSGKWVCEVREPNKKTRIWLGTFQNAEMAARAHDVAALALKGRRSACINFADSAWRLPVPDSADPKDIRKAAADAAEAFRPMEASDGALSSEEMGNETKEVVSSVVEERSSISDMDEKASAFSMPELLADMAAEGLLPPLQSNGDGYMEDEEGDINAYVSLWSHSI
ncbi:dehydration-responsive element-binding protein 1A-like [Punica granatum]|uniref:Uncharacterized protein n=2 Tax=Punica granatum TaxID=22663 RepID=A0A2I0HVR5_PUNGR|nr:dehydration-responsive element-binding protein 1A-like [Punica granatum]PKI35782.1 hypothetical protein CRG98_043817 [Punica granatum]